MKLLAGAVFLIFTIATLGVLRPAFPFGSATLGYLLVLMLSFVSTLVHEIGHAGVAAKVGAQVHRIVVLPFEYRVDTRRLGWAKTIRSREIGGYVVYSLDRIEARRKHVLIALAGPAANFVLATVLGGAALLIAGLHPPLPVGSGVSLEELIALSARTAPWRWISAVLQALALLSLGAGLVNLIPFRGSDGHAVMRALRRRQPEQW